MEHSDVNNSALEETVKQSMTEMTFHLDLERCVDFELKCLAPYLIFINSISVMEYENVLTGNLNNVYQHR